MGAVPVPLASRPGGQHLANEREDRWDRVEWTSPVREIAAALQVSRQRVYQVMAERGVPRRRWGALRTQLLRLDTRSLTAAQAAAHVGCSVEYARDILRAAGRSYRRVDRSAKGDCRYAGFASWLRRRYAYSAGTVKTLCVRCRRVERAHALRLDRILVRPEALADLSRLLETESARAARRSVANNDRFAIRRYAEFVRTGRRSAEG